MDLTSAITLVPTVAALVGVGVPVLSWRKRLRSARQAELRYLEEMLVEARRYTFPVAARRVRI